MLQSVEEERAAGSDFYNIRVHSAAQGTDVALMQIANIRGEFAFNRVARRNQERALTVEFKHEVLKAPELLEAATPLVEELGLGEDYRWEVGGEIEKQAETMPKLFKWLPHFIISRDPVFYSLALIIATGLAFGTVLTLGVVPVLYSILFRVKKPLAA